MRKFKKILAVAAAFSMTAAAFLAPVGASEVKAASFTAIAQYDFENGTGMNSSGISGTAPTVVSDAERGNVLQFADGASSSIVTHDTDTSLEEHSWRIEEGSPSSLKFPNPFKGRSLTGATISFWVKLPSEKAGGILDDGEVDETGAVAAGLVGFVDSEFRNLQHPDCTVGGHSDLWWGGRSCFGITAQPRAYFAMIHHNCIIANDAEAHLADDINVWRYCAMAITNDTITVYLDGQPVKSTEITKSKRFFGSEEYENPGNEGMPFLLDFLRDDMSYTFGGKAGTTTLIDKNSKQSVTYGKIPSDVQCYVGFTGFSPTYAGVCMDDLSFFTQAFSASEMAALYEAAKVPGGIAVSGGGGVSSSGGSAGNTGAAHSAVSAEAAAALASSTKLVSAPEGVTIGAPIPILKDDPALGGTFDALKAAMDAGLGAILAENPDWKDLKFSDNIYIQDIPLTGRELADGEKAVVEMDIPAGFDVNMLWVLRINDDGSLTKCNIVSMENGKLQFETDKLCKFAIVQMTTGSAKITQAGTVSSAVFILFGAAAIVGGVWIIMRKKKSVEE